MKQVTIFYATRSPFKREELDILCREVEVPSLTGSHHKIGELVDFRISDIPTDEPLEIDLEAMVRHKSRSAYRDLLTPCIVEHAGLILEAHKETGFPGGLTQPMWDALPIEDFLKRTGFAGERAIARAVVGYCDGMRVKTFVGDTHGVIATGPRGSRSFYWDPVFCPDEGGGLTYAEMTDAGPEGLKNKLLISQSARALSKFVSHLAGSADMGIFGVP